jgi:hypothetical protein
LAENANKYKIMDGEPGKNISVERYSSRWEDNIKMDFTEYMDQGVL